MRANYALSVVALAVLASHVALIVYVTTFNAHRFRGYSDTFDALGLCLLAELLAAVVAGAVIRRLKRQEVSLLDASARRWRRIGLAIARLAFWFSILPLLVLPVAMFYVFMSSFVLLG